MKMLILPLTIIISIAIKVIKYLATSRSIFTAHCHKQSMRLDTSVTGLGDLFDFGQLFKAFGNN